MNKKKIENCPCTFEEWDGKPLKGTWEFSRKIDGIQAQNRKEGITSRNGTKLSNLPLNPKKFEIAEVYTGKLQDVFSIIMSPKSKRRRIKNTEIYPLFPVIDKRLFIGIINDPSEDFITELFRAVVNKGYEGLVMKQGTRCIKVKPEYTTDVKILDFVPGEGKHRGMVKDFITEKGKVGIGLTEAQRKEYFDFRIIGTYIEVKSTGFIDSGKFRHPRFVRLRPDK